MLKAYVENYVQPPSQQWVFINATRGLFVTLGCVLEILYPHDAYEKCSTNFEESNGTDKSDIRHVYHIICKEKEVFIDFKKMVPWHW